VPKNLYSLHIGDSYTLMHACAETGKNVFINISETNLVHYTQILMISLLFLVTRPSGKA